jgi:hypothetical protein
MSGVSDLVNPIANNSDSIARKILFLSKSDIFALSIPGLKKAKVLYFVKFTLES